MKQQNIRISQFVGLLGCLLAITSCCLFRSPKDPNQIQDPPATDRNYLACRVNGKPTQFKRFGPLFRQYSSVFRIQEDLESNKLILEVRIYGGHFISKDRYDEVSISETYVISNNLDTIDRVLFEKREVTDAFFERTIPKEGYRTYETHTFNLGGNFQITDFEYVKDPRTDSFKGYVSGVFELNSDSLDTGGTPEIRLTSGVFNVSEIDER